MSVFKNTEYKFRSSPRNDTTSLIGERFGRYVVVGFAGRCPKYKWKMWKCKCDCGEVRDKYAFDLDGEEFPSCGCLAKEKWNSGLKSDKWKLLNKPLVNKVV